jgi:hypothetical protein
MSKDKSSYPKTGNRAEKSESTTKVQETGVITPSSYRRGGVFLGVGGGWWRAPEDRG